MTYAPPSEIVTGLFVSGWPQLDIGPFQTVVSCLSNQPHVADKNFHFCPLTDDAFEIVKGDWARAQLAADFAASEVQRGHRVLVFCREGMNRSGLVAALAVRLLRRCSGQEALELVQARRAGSLYNWHFKKALMALSPPAAPEADAPAV